MSEDGIPDHDLLSPSSADRWLACPASLKESEGKDRPDTVYTLEGTRAHDLAALAVEQMLGTLVPKFEYDSSEQQDAVEQYTWYLRSQITSLAIEGWTRVHFAVETRVRSTEIADFGGTVDYFAIWQRGDEQIGQICDFKYGSGVPVAVQGNPQLVAYAALLSERYPGVTEWRAAIVQPRCQSDGQTIREATITQTEVKLFRLMASQVLQQSDVYQTGDHCRWCPAKASCSVFYDTVLQEAMNAFLEPEPDDYDVLMERWLHLLKHRDAINSVLKEVHGNVLRSIEQGRKVEGWKAVVSKGHRRWTKDESVVIRKLRQIYGVSKKEATETSLRSPAQLEKLLKTRKADLSGLNQLVERPEIGLRLVPDFTESSEDSVTDKLKEFDNG